MNTSVHTITVSGLRVEVVRKAIKNLHLGVYPPNGRIRVAAPLAINDDAVRLAVVTSLPWIKKQQAGFSGQERQSPRRYVSGETHFVFANRLRLRFIEQDGPPVRHRQHKDDDSSRPAGQRREDPREDRP